MIHMKVIFDKGFTKREDYDLLAHLSRRLMGSLSRRPSVSACARASTFSKISETAWPIKAKYYM